MNWFPTQWTNARGGYEAVVSSSNSGKFWWDAYAMDPTKKVYTRIDGAHLADTLDAAKAAALEAIEKHRAGV